jgi:polysaccharide export outer membrane protein
MAPPKPGKAIVGKTMRSSLVKAALSCLLVLLICAIGASQTLLRHPYLLKPEDVLRIQVFGQSQITADVPVGIDGTVSAPFLGSVMAAGKTLDALQAELTNLYESKMRIRDPIVSVTVIQFRQLRASIGGAVGKPGSVQIRPGDTVLSLLNNGGGAIRDEADLRRAYLRHANSLEIIPLDLYAMTVLGDMSQNYQLQDGDEVTVPEERNNHVTITGAVQHPGQYVYHEPMTLADAIALGGGEIRYRSRFSGTIIIREKEGLPGQYVTIHANFVRFVRKSDQTQNVVLQPGDFIFVPESNSPDYVQINALFNVAYIVNVLGGGSVFTHIFGG